MSISYSGIVNYGKATLPSVEEWGRGNNIIRDPPRSIMTRNIDYVGDTMEIVSTLANSNDRYSESINYYARNINPSVSVSYGEAGSQGMGTSRNGEAFLPYRVIRDGAFRPPVWSQEDLLPLSRLPRNWTTIDPRPFEVNYAKRIQNCGTAETTKEVHNEIRKINCETRKIIAAEPTLTAPQPKYMLKDPLAPGLLEPNKSSCGLIDPSIIDPRELPHLTLNRPLASAYVNKHNPKIHKEFNRPDITLRDTRMTTSVRSNNRMMKEVPVIANNIMLSSNHPMAEGCTNPNGAIFEYKMTEADYDRLLPKKLDYGSFGCKPSIPATATSHGIKILNKVR